MGSTDHYDKIRKDAIKLCKLIYDVGGKIFYLSSAANKCEIILFIEIYMKLDL